MRCSLILTRDLQEAACATQPTLQFFILQKYNWAEIEWPTAAAAIFCMLFGFSPAESYDLGVAFHWRWSNAIACLQKLRSFLSQQMVLPCRNLFGQYLSVSDCHLRRRCLRRRSPLFMFPQFRISLLAVWILSMINRIQVILRIIWFFYTRNPSNWSASFNYVLLMRLILYWINSCFAAI